MGSGMARGLLAKWRLVTLTGMLYAKNDECRNKSLLRVQFFARATDVAANDSLCKSSLMQNWFLRGIGVPVQI